jgi:hypothetical protein
MEFFKGMFRQHKEGDWPDYPIALDVVIWKDNSYQLAVVAQTKSYRDAIYTVTELESNGQQFRIKGAQFHRTVSQDPPAGNVYRRREGVRVTGELIGGKRQRS